MWKMVDYDATDISGAYAAARIDALFGDFKRELFRAGSEQIWVAGRR
jgi:hypothetical protein